MTGEEEEEEEEEKREVIKGKHRKRWGLRQKTREKKTRRREKNGRVRQK